MPPERHFHSQGKTQACLQSLVGQKSGRNERTGTYPSIQHHRHPPPTTPHQKPSSQVLTIAWPLLLLVLTRVIMLLLMLLLLLLLVQSLLLLLLLVRLLLLLLPAVLISRGLLAVLVCACSQRPSLHCSCLCVACWV